MLCGADGSSCAWSADASGRCNGMNFSVASSNRCAVDAHIFQNVIHNGSCYNYGADGLYADFVSQQPFLFRFLALNHCQPGPGCVDLREFSATSAGRTAAVSPSIVTWSMTSTRPASWRTVV